MVENDKEFKELVSSTIASMVEVAKDKDLGLSGLIEFELAIITNKTAAGKLKLFLVEAGADYEKEKLSKMKFKIGSKKGILTTCL